MNNSDADPRAAFGGLFDPNQIAACRERALQHADLRMYGTLHVVADLDEVRARLGYERVVLWAGSGGTRTALVWLREHPDRIEAVALDGVTPPYFRAPSLYARGSQDALDRVFADCDSQTSCKEAYPDLRGDFERLLQRFDEGPVETFVTKQDNARVTVEMHRGDFGYAVRGILYSSDLIARLPKMIYEAASTNDFSAFAQLHWQRDVRLRPFVAMGVHFSVFGTEDVPFIEAASIPELTNRTFLGRYLIDQYTAACKAWGGRGLLPDDFHEPVQSNAPVLLLSGYYDPSTPPSVAEEVASHLPNSRHIVVRNEAHGAGFGCARQLVVDFLTNASLEGLGSACDDVGPIEFETP
jgi:pimeloyl-ACP methyl ester carboxylesterase